MSRERTVKVGRENAFPLNTNTYTTQFFADVGAYSKLEEAVYIRTKTSTA